MKTTLTIEQSAELIKRGVTLNENDSEVFDIGELFSLLPKELYGEETDYCDCELHIHANKLGWSASYMEIRGSEVVVMKLTSYGVELIDTLFSLLCKLLDTHVKLD